MFNSNANTSQLKDQITAQIKLALWRLLGIIFT